MELARAISVIIIGGVLPTLFWLYYWLREDHEHPEPRRRILVTFLLGALSVPVAGLIERFVNILLAGDGNVNPADIFFTSYTLAGTILILWAVIEEFLKYIAAHIGGISRKDNNEPIDPVIYMITAALGFAACENALYVLKEFSHVGYISSSVLLTGNFRFIGSTLLHTAASGIIGLFIAFSYYKTSIAKYNYLLVGFIVASALHTIFNSFIIRQEEFTLIGFSVVWFAIIAMILLFEKVKQIKQEQK